MTSDILSQAMDRVSDDYDSFLSFAELLDIHKIMSASLPPDGAYKLFFIRQLYDYFYNSFMLVSSDNSVFEDQLTLANKIINFNGNIFKETYESAVSQCFEWGEAVYDSFCMWFEESLDCI